MLLVDYSKTEIAELHVVFDKGVSSHNNVYVTGLQSLVNLPGVPWLWCCL